jgi:hypothetical protein
MNKVLRKRFLLKVDLNQGFKYEIDVDSLQGLKRRLTPIVLNLSCLPGRNQQVLGKVQN